MGDTELVQLYKELPSFASAENRKIHASLKKDFDDYEKLKIDCTDLTERVAVLKEHFKNVTSEVDSTQKLVVAKEEQVKEEQHLKQLNEREMGQIRSQMSKIEERISVTRGKWSELQGRVFKAQERINAFKAESEENEKQLKLFQEIAQQKEDDFQTIARYKMQDEKHIKKLIEQIEKQSTATDAKKKELEQEVLATKALQIELDTTANQFRQLHEERTQILQMWEDALNKMKAINQSIEEKTGLFDERKKVIDKVHQNVVDERRTLEVAQNDNKDCEKRMNVMEHQVIIMHKDLENETQQLGEFREVVENLRGKLSKLESDERFHREEIEEIKNKTLQEQRKKQAFQDRLDQTIKAYSTQEDETGDIQAQIDLINKTLDEENAQVTEFEKLIEAEKKQHYLAGGEVTAMKKKLADVQAELSGSKARSATLSHKIDSYDAELQKQTRLIYNANYQIQGLERKIRNITVGEETGEEREALEKRIQELETLDGQKAAEVKNLLVQVNRLELELKSATKKRDSLTEVNKKLSNDLNELWVEIRSLERAQEKAREDKASAVVQLNMLRLQVEKMNDMLNEKANEVISLANRKEQLKLSAQERMVEIENHLAALKIQLKTEEEAKHKAVVELAERKKQEQVNAAKYEIVSKTAFGPDGEMISQSDRVIQIAREKQSISAHGDQLEAEISKALTELKALERATVKLNRLNGDFKDEMRGKQGTQQEQEHMALLKQTIKKLQDGLNRKISEAQSAQSQRQMLENTYNDTQDQIEKDQKKIQELNAQMEKMSKEHNDLNDKLKRASKMLQIEIKKRREEDKVDSSSDYPSSLREKDIEIKIMTWNVENAADQMLKIAESNPEIEPQVRLAMHQLGIKFRPQVPSLKIHPPGSGSGSGSRSSNPRHTSSINSAQSARSGASFRSRRSNASNNSAQSARSTNSHVSVKVLSFEGL